MARVLVVDDDRMVRDALRDYLEFRGHTVDAAEGGSAALKRLAAQEYPPDVAIIDVELRGEDGRDVAHRIKASFRSVRVIIISGSAGNRLEEVRASTRVFGPLNFFTKPMALAPLCRRIEELAQP